MTQVSYIMLQLIYQRNTFYGTAKAHSKNLLSSHVLSINIFVNSTCFTACIIKAWQYSIATTGTLILSNYMLRENTAITSLSSAHIPTVTACTELLEWADSLSWLFSVQGASVVYEGKLCLIDDRKYVSRLYNCFRTIDRTINVTNAARRSDAL